MPWVGGRFEPESTITCIDCGGVAHLLDRPLTPDDLPIEEGDVVAYRCADCLDAWYLEVPPPDVEG